MSRRVDVACVQLEPPAAGEGREERVARVAEQVGALSGTDLIVLPELWPAGYFAFDDYAAVAEPLDGPTTQAIAAAARAAGAHVVGGSFVERRASGELTNTCFVADPGGAVVASYRKIHVFGYRSREQELIAGGAELVVAETGLGRLGLAICYDLRFPELFRGLLDGGAELVVLPAAWPAVRLEHWRLLTRARALENQVFMIACGAAGTDHGTELAGHSAVIGPGGEVRAEAGAEPGVLRAAIDLDEVARVRADFRVHEDRRLRP